MTAAVTGYSVHVPGGGLPDGGPEPACPPERAHELLGRKGLLAKEPATRLALCAVHRALGLPPKAPRASGPPDARTAVVVASNLGNAGTVAGVARTVRHGALRDVSPLDAPNASSNVIASTIAIWFRFGGPNLMVCSGATAGLDALELALLLLRAGRAERVVLAAAEPDDALAAALQSRRATAPGPLRAGAACVVLEPVPTGGAALACDRPGPLTAAAGDPGPTVTVDPGGAAAEVVDLTERAGGDTYGASGVVGLAVAAALLQGAAGRAVVRCGDGADGWRSANLERGVTSA